MAKGRKRRTRRATYTYIGKQTRAQIRDYSKFVPGLSKLKGKQRLSSSEMAQLTRAKKALRHTENLIPVTEKQAKKLSKKGMLVGRGVRAIRLRNTSPGATVKVLKGGVVVTSNGRRWEYHPYLADIDTLSSAGHALLTRPDVAQINLWTNRGRANEGFRTEKSWDEYLYKRFAQYVQQQEFVEGVAALIKDKKKSA